MIHKHGEEEELAKLVERLDKASTAYGMEISAEKTKLMTRQSAIRSGKLENGQPRGPSPRSSHFPRKATCSSVRTTEGSASKQSHVYFGRAGRFSKHPFSNHTNIWMIPHCASYNLGQQKAESALLTVFTVL